jgi:hypothetical protein
LKFASRLYAAAKKLPRRLVKQRPRDNS